MVVVFNDKVGNTISLPIDSSKICLPRIGEKVFCGYQPIPRVSDVCYKYDIGMILIVMDGIGGKVEFM